jgi:transposase
MNMRIGVGIDWGADEHEICVVMEGDIGAQQRWRVPHRGADIEALFDKLAALSPDAKELWVAIEMPHGTLVDTALDRGMRVFAISPKQLDRFRDRYFTSGKKDDKTDAYVMARTVLSDTDCFRELAVRAPQYVMLREWSRQREVLVGEQTALINRIKGALRRYYPSFLELGNVVSEAWGRELFALAKTPHKAARLRVSTFDKLLRRHRIRRLSAQQVRDILCAQPLHLAPGVTEAIVGQLRHSFARLELVQAQLADAEREMERLVAHLHDAHVTEQAKLAVGERTPSDVEIWTSLDGVGKVVLGTMLGEAHVLIASHDLASLRGFSGCAPVTRNTGQRENRYAPRKASFVHMRYACSEHLRSAVYHLGRTASVFSPVYKPRYAAMRARGHSHGRACRQIADQILHVAFAMLRDRTTYDRTRALTQAAATPAA